MDAHDPAFSRRLGARGWIGMTWPKRYGGRERTALERYVVTEEMLAAGAPVAAHWFADRQGGPQLLRFGTEEQRERFLPGIARGECSFAIGMSEPDAGSDLAAVRTLAEQVAGGWRVNGRKVWTSHARASDYMIALCRTDGGRRRRTRASPADRGPARRGIAIGPIVALDGEPHFNEVRSTTSSCPTNAGRRGRRGLGAGDLRAGVRAQRARALPEHDAAPPRCDRRR